VSLVISDCVLLSASTPRKRGGRGVTVFRGRISLQTLSREETRLQRGDDTALACLTSHLKMPRLITSNYRISRAGHRNGRLCGYIANEAIRFLFPLHGCCRFSREQRKKREHSREECDKRSRERGAMDGRRFAFVILQPFPSSASNVRAIMPAFFYLKPICNV